MTCWIHVDSVKKAITQELVDVDRCPWDYDEDLTHSVYIRGKTLCGHIGYIDRFPLSRRMVRSLQHKHRDGWPTFLRVGNESDPPCEICALRRLELEYNHDLLGT